MLPPPHQLQATAAPGGSLWLPHLRVCIPSHSIWLFQSSGLHHVSFRQRNGPQTGHCMPLPHPPAASALDPRVTLRKSSCAARAPSVAPGRCTEDTAAGDLAASRALLPEECRLDCSRHLFESHCVRTQALVLLGGFGIWKHGPRRNLAQRAGLLPVALTVRPETRS